MTMEPVKTRRKIRCASYTRKSSEEGLEQDFNSLDAQYEACAAYVASQRHEGWKLGDARYDDGGKSGGSLERPAMQRLLEDIEAGKVDMVVVYKIDRLTRSLTDFAKLVERFDQRGCSFVSVTQAFNTSTSMGRLTLNVLLSFAQFEREVTAERIRDKIGASKKRGLWMGGMVPMGYDVDPDPDKRGLLVNEREAEQIRTIFTLYDRMEDLKSVAREVARLGMLSKARIFASGKTYGGKPLSHGKIHYMLTNPIYIGKIRHKHNTYEGLHKGIVDQALWDRVQTKLQAHASRPRVRDRQTQKLKAPKARSPLAGKLFDESGDRLTPSHSQRGSKRNRYYISSRLVTGHEHKDNKDPAAWRLPALKLERAIAREIARHLRENQHHLLISPDPVQLYRTQSKLKRIHTTLMAGKIEAHSDLIDKAIIAPGQLSIYLSPTALAQRLDCDPGALDPEKLTIKANFQLRKKGVESKIILGEKEAEPDHTLIRAMAKAHGWMREVRNGISAAAIGRRHGWTDAPVRQRLKLALLSPKITRAILQGKQPIELSLKKLLTTAIPYDWDAQWQALGFADDS
jgi:site-specific DNA recombinase